MKEPFYYRNKVHAVFDRDRRGNIISGTYEANSHRVVPIEECRTFLKALPHSFVSFLTALDMPGPDIDSLRIFYSSYIYLTFKWKSV